MSPSYSFPKPKQHKSHCCVIPKTAAAPIYRYSMCACVFYVTGIWHAL